MAELVETEQEYVAKLDKLVNVCARPHPLVMHIACRNRVT